MIRDEKITDAAERGARLTLPAGGDDQHLVPRQAHRFVEADRRRKIAQVTGRLGDPQDPIERAAGNAHLALRFQRDPADRLQARRVRREGRHQHPPLGLRDLREEPFVNALLGARRRILEDVRRIAHQREHAFVPDLRQHLRARRLAQHRGRVDLPVAGVEDVSERRLDQQPVAFGNRVGQRDEADLERAELNAPAALDDVELDPSGQPLFLELAGDQPCGERRREQRRLQLFGEVGQRPDMVLMAVRQDDPDQPLLLALDELKIGEDEIDPGIFGVGERQAEVGHDPLPAAAVEIDVHADLARAAEGAE